MNFPSHDLNTAPEDSKPLLEKSQKTFGRLPGLHKVLAESPQAYEAYQLLHKLFTETNFDADELTVVWQAINVEHSCHYCVPAHTGIAKMMKDSLRCHRTYLHLRAAIWIHNLHARWRPRAKRLLITKE